MEKKKHPDGTVSEEASALGERVKGAAKEGIGAISGNERLEREGERENAEGRDRQGRNDAVDLDNVRNSAGIEQPRTTTAPNSIREETTGERDKAQRRMRQATNDAVDPPGTPRSWDSSWSDKHLVTGLYDTPGTAGKAYDDLTKRHGYKAEDISVVMTDETRKRHFGDVRPGTEFKEGTKAAEGAGIGGGIGLSVGAALGAIVAAATTIAIPGLGLVVAGPIAGAIAGAGAGGATGTLLGGLIGAGIPETRAIEYERGLKEGGIVLGTRARDDAHATELERDFTDYGARNVLMK
jgi:uncharacterized protein YjbJ (UPF0337 family)